jgi:hypothetical protein
MSDRESAPALVAALSPPVRRLVALALLVVLVFGAASLIHGPALRWSAASLERRADARFDLERLRAATRTLESLSPATIEADEARLREWLAPGATEAEATLAIQSLVGRTLTGEGMSVEAMRVESAQDLAGLRVLAIVWRGTADEPALAQALAQLESARPVLRIDRIALRTIGTEQGVSRLSADIRVGALWAAPPAAPGDAGPSSGAPAAPGESSR